jgi:hypothetical protein
LATLHKELNTYAMSIPSHCGTGNHGHLTIVMDDAEYLALTGTAFEIPLHPGANPPTLSGGTAPQITENNMHHAAAIVDHDLYHKTDRELTALLLKAVPWPFV